jgi:hypothetical protein
MGTQDRGAWKDDVLRRLARKRVPLPVDVTELTHAALRRRTRRIILITVGIEFAALAILLAAFGIFPGFVDESRIGFDAEAELWLAAALIGLPVGCGLLVRWLIGPRIRRRPDEADHPWRFLVTAEGMDVTTAGGRRLAGPWSRWTYRGYRYLVMKHNRIPTGLTVACDDTEIFLELSRFSRRDALALVRGVLQGLESAGHTDS